MEKHDVNFKEHVLFMRIFDFCQAAYLSLNPKIIGKVGNKLIIGRSGINAGLTLSDREWACMECGVNV
jgi:hypothetical protein